MTQTQIFICGTLLTIAGYVFNVLIIKPLQQSIDGLSLSIKTMQTQLNHMTQTMIRHDEQIKNVKDKVETFDE